MGRTLLELLWLGGLALEEVMFWHQIETVRFDRFLRELMKYKGIGGCPACNAPELDLCVEDCPVRKYRQDLRREKKQ